MPPPPLPLALPPDETDIERTNVIPGSALKRSCADGSIGSDLCFFLVGDACCCSPTAVDMVAVGVVGVAGMAGVVGGVVTGVFCF